MAYHDFLRDFASLYDIKSVDELLENYSEKFAFQIGSRERAKENIKALSRLLQINFKGLKILDVGCGYGSYAIEYAKLGADVVGIDVLAHKIEIARSNALNEVNVPFLKADASSRRTSKELMKYGRFDFVLLNDVLEHVYDTAGLLYNLKRLMKPGSNMYFKVPNGLATRNVLLEGHRKIFGISLLAPDYWPKFIKPPFSIYYRRWEYFTALFKEYEFKNLKILNEKTDVSFERTQNHIKKDLRKIREYLKLENFDNTEQFKVIGDPINLYIDEVETDYKNLSWEELFFKYRVKFWEGIIQA